MKTQIKLMEFGKKLLKGEVETSPYYKKEYEKDLQQESDSLLLPRIMPEQVGVSSSYLFEFLKEISACTKEHLHGVCIVHKGSVILEQGYSPYTIQDWHISHSLAKSITALAIGCLISDGQLALHDPIVDIFNKRKVLFGHKMNKVTVLHLLTMSSGITFNELDTVFEKDWLNGCLGSNVDFEPGSKFSYNSMNTYLLSAIVVEKTKKGLLEYLRIRLLSEMGIGQLFWEKCPLGIEKGGWGLSLTMEDMAKFGILYMQQGMWNGKQLLSKEYMKFAVQKQIDTPESISPYGYGYHIWICSRKGTYQFNGMFGQNVFLLPDIETVIVTTAGGEHFFPKSKVFDIVMDYFAHPAQEVQRRMIESRRKYIKDLYYQNKKEKIDLYFYKKLNDYGKILQYNQIPSIEEDFFQVPQELLCEEPKKEETSKWKDWWKDRKRRLLDIGKKGKVEREERKPQEVEKQEADKQKQKEGNQGAVLQMLKNILDKKYVFGQQKNGILPLFLQMMHGTYSSGISYFYLRMKQDLNKEQEQIEFIFQEGETEKILKIGIQYPIYSTYEIEGMLYKIGVIGKWCWNEEDILVLKVTICFVETSHTRMVYLYFEDEKVTMKLKEEPNLLALLEEVPMLLGGESKDMMMKLATSLKDMDYSKYLLKKVIEPVIEGEQQK